MQNLIRIVLFGGLLILTEEKAIAQNPDLPKIISPSPTAASLGKFGNIPIGYYTGTPNISIPIYEIKTKDLSLPIVLSYDATGVRVSQDATWVGLNWSLSAGGLVTRVVRGLDDFGTNGYFGCAPLPTNDNTDANTYFADVWKGVKDGEPDIFSYNFAGYSGKFVIDKQSNTAKPFGSQRNNLDIEFGNDGSFFNITTPDGSQYYFSTKEIVTNLSTGQFSGTGTDPANYTDLGLFPNASQAANTSWYLDKITSPAGDTIRFIYKNGYSMGLISRNEKDYLDIDQGAFGVNEGVGEYLSKVDSRQVTQDVYLEKIEFSNGRVEFETSNRDDMEAYGTNLPPQQLSDIKVYNNTQTAPLKVITLGKSYFETFNPNGSRYFEKRLRLDYVQFDQPGNQYTFSYHNANSLPSKYSRQVDEWGFYTSPFYNPFSYTTSFNYPDLFPRANTANGVVDGVPQQRDDATGEYLKTGILTSMTYPTKGSTAFEYEPNDYGNADPTHTRQESIAIIDLTDPDPNNQINDGSQTITLTQSTYVTFNGLVSFNSTSPIQIGYLRNANGDLLYTFTPDANPQNLPYGATTYTAYLAPGQYTIEAVQIANQMTKIDAVWDVTQSLPVVQGAGLRIKSITDYDANNTIIGKKTFAYNLENSAISSGLLLKKSPDYYERDILYSEGPYPYQTSPFSAENYRRGFYLVRSSNSFFSDGFYTMPNVVGYSRVSVTDGINGGNGTTIYNYYNQESTDELNPNNYPEAPILFDSRNGQLLNTEIRDNTGNLVHKTENQYTLKERYSIKGLQTYRTPFEPSYLYDFVAAQPGLVDLSTISNYYDNFSEWWVQSQKTETSYFNNATQTVVVVQNDSYDNPLHRQITSSQVVNSDQTTSTTYFKYPHDFSTQEPYTTMVSRNIINPVVEMDMFKSSTTLPLEVSKTNFDFWWNGGWSSNVTGALTVPRTVEVQPLGSSSKTRIQYDTYDNHGGILSVSKAGGPKISYIWAYNNQYPVAECNNAAPSEIYYEGFEESAVSALQSNGGHTGHNYVNGNFTVNWAPPPGSARSFVISYWYKNASGVWTYQPEQAYTTGMTLSNGTAYDDIRVYPNDAQMSTYTYDPLIGMTSSTDAKGLTTYYEYDGLQRLMNVRDKDGNILKHTDYHYQNQ